MEDEENENGLQMDHNASIPSNLGRRSTVVEVGREADGYLSDTEDSEDDLLFVPRSASEVQLNSVARQEFN